MTHGDRVREFHLHQGFDVDLSLKTAGPLGTSDDSRGGELLQQYAKMLAAFAKKLDRGVAHVNGEYDPRLMRAHLLLEELSEVLKALAERDEVELLDGLADLDYVLWGCAETFNVPLEAAHREVHSSNMTKKKHTRDDPRCRSKGDCYVPPDLKRVLEDYRNEVSVH